MKTSFIVPVYNEEKGIKKNLLRIFDFAKKNYSDFEIIVVDDGSQDSTWKILQELNYKNLILGKNPHNMGPGAAFRRGFSLARGEVIVTLDFDLSFPITDTPKLLKKLNEGYDLVLASPYLLKGSTHKGIPPLRLFLSLAAVFIYGIAVGKILTCYTGFFRAYRKNVTRSIKFESNGFESQVEIIWKARRAGFKIVEVPSTLIYDNTRISNFKIVREISRHLHFLFGILMWGNIRYWLRLSS